MVKVRYPLLIMFISFIRNVYLIRFMTKVLYVGYSHSLSQVKSRKDSMLLQSSLFTHGYSSWSYFYLHMRATTTRNYVKKLNLFREKKMSPLLTLSKGLYKTIVDLMTMIDHQKKTLINWIYLLFIIPFQKLSYK